jgi:NAD(P)-dependent dehydrogenase (short-subunit alcohol dehydrogenase family)
MDLDLNGRIAVVTGASKGIGLAVTQTLLEAGHRPAPSCRASAFST